MTKIQHLSATESAEKHIAAAHSFIASLFLGVGKFDKRECATFAEALKAIEALRKDNPLCSRKPMIYAVMDAFGRCEFIDYSALSAERRAELSGQPAPTTKAKAISSEKISGPSAQEDSMQAPKLYGKKPSAQKAAQRAGLKAGEYEIATKGKEFFIRMLDAPKAKAEPAPANKAKRAAAVAVAEAQPVKAKPAKAKKEAKAPREPKAKPTGKRAAIVAAAEAGKLPAKPDFTAPTHARFRAKLDEVIALVKAGDIKALKAIEIKPVSTSPRAIARYRDLAVIALEAQARA